MEDSPSSAENGEERSPEPRGGDAGSPAASASPDASPRNSLQGVSFGVQALTSSTSGIRVLGATKNEESSEEEDEEGAEDVAMETEPPRAPAPRGLATSASQIGQRSQQAEDDAEEEEEEEDDAVDDRAGQEQDGSADEEDRQEDEEEDEEAQDGQDVAQDAAPIQDQAMVPADVQGHAEAPQSMEEDESQVQPEAPAALVPAETTAPPLGESWGSLSQDTYRQWTVSEEYSCLEVAGTVLKLPRAVYDRLFGYQRQGVAWMWNLYHRGFGGILADEMGLGKTVQVAALLACLHMSKQGSRFLLVVPPTLLQQWRRELKSWASECSGLHVHVFHGSTQERRTALRNMLSKGGAMLTSYDLTRNDINYLQSASLANVARVLPKKRKRQNRRGCRDDDSPSEEEEDLPEPPPGGEDENLPWDAVVVDEGHQIKNPSCLVGRALRKLKSRSRFLLTGTPLQNALSDLWALMDFAQPGLLGNASTFERNFSEQIAKGSKRNASRFAVELKDHLARELKRITAPHFLRRMKSEVAASAPGALSQVAAAASSADPGTSATPPSEDMPEEMPAKTDVVLWLNLTPAQVELYNMYLGSETVRRATGASKCGMEALKAIAILKKLCNHPLLCLPQNEFNDWKTRTVSSGAAPAPQSRPASSSGAAPGAGDADDSLDATQPAAECQDVVARLRALLPGSVQGAALLSCKLRVLSVLLPQLQKRGHRCLIFSQSVRMLDLIQSCVLRVLQLKFLRIDGSIDPKDRDLKLSKFQAPGSRYFCMCLSSSVGSVGLTITAADRVILTDPAWNPAMDAQAIDRVHRLGQTREVVVYRLVGAGAIEDKMFRLQVFKRGLAKTALEQESQVRLFSHKDLKQLFEPPNQSASTQSLMAEQLGTEALEHEDLLKVVAGDIGSTDDPQALPFWQSSDVLGFSDYQRLFMYLEQYQGGEEEVKKTAKDLVESLRNEDYVKDQVVDGKWRPNAREKENSNPQNGDMVPLPDAAE